MDGGFQFLHPCVLGSPRFQVFQRARASAGGEGQHGESGIRGALRGKGGGIGDKKSSGIPTLVMAIEHRVREIIAHPGGAAFVQGQTRRGVGRGYAAGLRVQG